MPGRRLLPKAACVAGMLETTSFDVMEMVEAQLPILLPSLASKKFPCRWLDFLSFRDRRSCAGKVLPISR